MRGNSGTALALAAALLAAASPAGAVVFTVTKTADTADGVCDADCSLREAISAANASPGFDLVEVTGGEYELTIPNPGDDEEDANASGDLDVTDDVTIQGGGLDDPSEGGTVILSLASNPSHGPDRAFEVLGAGVKVAIRDLILDAVLANRISTEGGCILLEDAELTVENVLFQQCHAGVHHPADVLVGGGGIAVRSGKLLIDEAEFQQNFAFGAAGGPYGGAILLRGGVAEIRRSVFFNCGSDAVAARPGSRARIVRSRFEGSGVASASPDLTVENSEILGDSSGSLRILPGGRGLLRHATVIRRFGASEAAIVSESPGQPRLANSIVKSQSGSGVLCSGGPAASLGYNVIGDSSCFAAGEGDVVNSSNPAQDAQGRVPPERCLAEDVDGDPRLSFCDAGADETVNFNIWTYAVNSLADRPDAAPADLVCDTGMLVGPPGEEQPECTLRAAVQSWNERSVFESKGRVSLGPGVHRLSIEGNDDEAALGDLDLLGDLEIVGAGAEETFIDTTGGSFGSYGRVLEARGTRLLLSDLAVERGDAGDAGTGTGGGLLVSAGDVAAIRVRFVGNRGLHGSAVDVQAGSFACAECRFGGNAPPQTAGTQGGAVRVGAGASASFTRSTFAANEASEAGGAVHVAAGGSAALENCTVSGNASPSFGGGTRGALYNAGTLSLRHVTLADNEDDASGGATELWTEAGGTTTLGASIVWGLAPACGGGGTVVSLGRNVGAAGCGLSDPSDKPGADPLLFPLSDNGGATPTTALAAASLAIDLVPEADCPVTDQRGVSRPQDSDFADPALCDAGAYEAVFIDADGDDDGVPDGLDNCRDFTNAGQADLDGDGRGDLCDADIDGDGALNDNCGAPFKPLCDCEPTDPALGGAEIADNDVDDDCDGVVDEVSFTSSCASAIGGRASAEGHAPAALLLAALALVRARRRARRRPPCLARPARGILERDEDLQPGRERAGDSGAPRGLLPGDGRGRLRRDARGPGPAHQGLSGFFRLRAFRPGPRRGVPQVPLGAPLGLPRPGRGGGPPRLRGDRLAQAQGARLHDARPPPPGVLQPSLGALRDDAFRRRRAHRDPRGLLPGRVPLHEPPRPRGAVGARRRAGRRDRRVALRPVPRPRRRPLAALQGAARIPLLGVQSELQLPLRGRLPRRGLRGAGVRGASQRAVGADPRVRPGRRGKTTPSPPPLASLGRLPLPVASGLRPCAPGEARGGHKVRPYAHPALLAALALLLSACGVSGGDGQAAPPIVYAPHAVLDIPTIVDADGSPDIADPHVLKIGGTWHLYATQSKRGLEVWLSEDLRSWRNAGLVWRPTPGAWNAKGQAWAPHVEPGAGGYWLYYTAHMRIGVAFSASPLGPFEEVLDRPLVGDGYGGIGDGSAPFDGTAAEFLDFEEFAIDAFLLKDSGGGMTLYFAAYNPFSRILALPMADYAAPAAAAPTVVLSPGVFDWEGFVNEGPWIVEREGRFHLMYSANFANSADYGVGVAVGGAPLGPFARYPTNPILRRNDAADFWGPGHHSLAPGAFGDALMFYHTKVDPEIRFDRRIRYAPIAFGADGLLALTVPQP